MNEMAPLANITIPDAPIDLTDSKRFSEIKLSNSQKAAVLSFVQQQLPTAAAISTLPNLCLIEFPEGLPRTLMTLKQGGFSSTIIDPITKKTAGTASLYSIADSALALGAFSMMSIATGQYFLKQINNRLDVVNQRIDKILEFLYGAKKAELIAEIHFVQFASQNYASIMRHEQQRLSTVMSLQNARKVAMKDIEFYIEQLNSLSENKDSLKSCDLVMKTCDEAFLIKRCLDYSMQLYEAATLLEIYYADNYDESFILFAEKNVVFFVEKSNLRIRDSFGKLKTALQNTRNDAIIQIDIGGKSEKQKKKYADSLSAIIDALDTPKFIDIRDRIDSSFRLIVQPATYAIKNDGSVFLSRN